MPDSLVGMANRVSGAGDAATTKRSVGRPPIYEDDADRPISVTLRLSPKSRAQLRDMAKAMDVLPGQIVSDAIERYFKHEFPKGVPTPREPKS